MAFAHRIRNAHNRAYGHGERVGCLADMDAKTLTFYRESCTSDDGSMVRLEVLAFALCTRAAAKPPLECGRDCSNFPFKLPMQIDNSPRPGSRDRIDAKKPKKALSDAL